MKSKLKKTGIPLLDYWKDIADRYHVPRFANHHKYGDIHIIDRRYKCEENNNTMYLTDSLHHIFDEDVWVYDYDLDI